MGYMKPAITTNEKHRLFEQFCYISTEKMTGYLKRPAITLLKKKGCLNRPAIIVLQKKQHEIIYQQK